MNVIKKAVVLSEQQKIDTLVIESLQAPGKKVEDKIEQLPEKKVKRSISEKHEKKSLNEEVLLLEKQLIKDAMHHCRNLREIASELSISEPTAWRKMKKHELTF